MRARYPRALIVCAIGPTLSDVEPAGRFALSYARTAIGGVVQTLRVEGDQRLRVLEFPEHNDASGYGCENHPNLTSHRSMAASLEALLSDSLGW